MPSLTAAEVASIVSGTLVRGSPAVEVTSVMPVDDAEPGSAAFVAKPGYAAALATTRASIVLVRASDAGAKIAPAATVVLTERPYVAFARLAQALAGRSPASPGISGQAEVAAHAEVHASASVGPFCVIGAGARIGPGAVLYPGVHVEAGASVGAGSLLYNHVVVREGCSVGAHCILHPGVVIGADGFGFAQEPDRTGRTTHVKIPQTGSVVVEDDVEIGAQSCVDRGTLGPTRIGEGTKIDNLVQVGHNAQIGPRCLLVAQSGVAGSSRLGEGVMLGAQAGVAGHVTVGSRTVVYAQSGVMRDLEAGVRVFGSPADERRRSFRSLVRIRALDRLFARVRALERHAFPNRTQDGGAQDGAEVRPEHRSKDRTKEDLS